MDFSLHLSSQLREHLRALRKARGLTQAALGRLLGVGQARIAEIESNPGAVSVDQLMKLLSALRVSMVLRDELAGARSPGAAASPASGAPDPRQKPTKPASVNAPTGEWDFVPLTGAGRRAASSVLASRKDTHAPTDARALRDANPQADVMPTSRRNFIVRPKKGSW